MTHQTISLGTSWKLFSVTLKGRKTQHQHSEVIVVTGVQVMNVLLIKKSRSPSRESPIQGTASYPESSRKHDFKLLSALISFALFSKYIYKSKQQFFCYVSFLVPVFVDLHSTLLTLTIIPSKSKIQLFSISSLPCCAIWQRIQNRNVSLWHNAVTEHTTELLPFLKQ